MKRYSRVARTGLMILVATLAGCRDEAPAPSGPSFIISDAAHSNGKPHFFFLPPMVAAPAPTGVFDAALAPEVQICRLAGEECEETIAIFTTTTNWGSERVRVCHVPHPHSGGRERAGLRRRGRRGIGT
jgi:hypothetical protein